MNSEPVVITGYQCISAAANSVAGLEVGFPPVPAPSGYCSSPFHEFTEEIPCFRIQGLDPVAVLGKVGLRTKNWATKLLLCCAESGFGDMLRQMPEEQRPGLCIGTAFGSVQSIGDFLSESIVHGVNTVNPQLFANTVINSPASNANIRFVLRALSATVSTGFNSSLDALTYCSDLIRRGHYERILVGGLEEVSYYALLGLQRSGALSASGRIRPFGADADGLLMGEGCALLMLESRSAAVARNAQPLAEVAGYSTTFAPMEKGNLSSHAQAARAGIEQACEMASIAPDSLGFIASGANGSPRLDALEAQVLTATCPGVPITAYKGRIGECYGASTALSTAFALTDMKLRRITGIGTGAGTNENAAILTADREGVESSSVLITSFSCDGHCGSIILRNLQ